MTSQAPQDGFTPSNMEEAIREMTSAITTLVLSNQADNKRADKRAANMLFLLGVATALLFVGTAGIGYTVFITRDNTQRVNQLSETVADLATETRLAKEGVTEATEQAKEIAAATPRIEVVTPAVSASSGKAAKAPQLAVVIPARTATPKTSAAPAAAAAPAVTVLIPTPSAIVSPGETPPKGGE